MESKPPELYKDGNPGEANVTVGQVESLMCQAQ